MHVFILKAKKSRILKDTGFDLLKRKSFIRIGDILV
jgi:hypothetical protein